MEKTKTPFYISYNHLTYICFVLVFLQTILLIGMQANNRAMEAEAFIHHNHQILNTMQQELSTINITNLSAKQLGHTLIQKTLPKANKIAQTFNSYLTWQFEHYTPTINQSAEFEISTLIENPYLLKINFPKQKITVYISFHLAPDTYWGSVITSIILLVSFLVICTIFIHISNFNLKLRVTKGLKHRNNANELSTDPTDSLIREVQSIVDQKTLMLSSLSHDLKTPLTELELKLHLLEDQNLAKSLLKCTSEITQISKTSLQYAKGFNFLEKEPSDLVELLETLASAANTKKQTVSFTTKLDECIYPTEYYLFKRMITNLIHNAKKYANNTTIQLNKTIESKVVITISDDGPGVPKEQLKKLGQPFFRVESKSHQQIKGTGLGLSIVKHIAQIHHMKVNFENNNTGGLVVTISEI
ncbi:HAMP domain-containing histidine kinase [Thiotrichales bacterium 19S11-10]|nr:HAMP domain-containing histidine kinase [Thiotrichales bacterium 19S11-10]MCF6808085.1 HAMP domain-containing histidine kinase [Thiotrichales bacterium 19S9-11]MCF6812100.1 HAMP domain-containing histidine kinase [Thiotrichales bacterium 19S9-12]